MFVVVKVEICQIVMKWNSILVFVSRWCQECEFVSKTLLDINFYQYATLPKPEVDGGWLVEHNSVGGDFNNFKIRNQQSTVRDDHSLII